MVRSKDVSALPSVVLKMVVLGIQKEKKGRLLLEKDLKKMRCHGILERLWNLKNKVMVVEQIQTNGKKG